jgi:hypothetical protein
MSFGGMMPSAPSSGPSGPFEAYLTSIASSPYSIGLAMFLLNTCSRFLPLELSREQEKFLNQPNIRRLIIFVIFFVATRNIVVAGMMSITVIIFITYLFNENSSLCLFGKKVAGPGVAGVQNPMGGLSPEEQQILKSLSDKAERTKPASTDTATAQTNAAGSRLHEKYQKALERL